MSRSLWTKLKNGIMGGPLPAHIYLDLQDPFHVRLWNIIRPPAKVPRRRRPRTRAQRFLVRAPVVVVLMAACGWSAYRYLATAEERSVVLFSEGMKLIGPGAYEAAIGRFSEALNVWPQNVSAYFERGNAHKALDQGDLALADWSRALDLNPRMNAAYTARGTFYRVKGEAQKALADLTRSIEIEPTVDAYYQRGQVYHALGRYESALEDFSRGIADSRGAPYVYRARSATRLALGDQAGADADRDLADGLEQQ